jgi:hypothetical protein
VCKREKVGCVNVKKWGTHDFVIWVVTQDYRASSPSLLLLAFAVGLIYACWNPVGRRPRRSRRCCPQPCLSRRFASRCAPLGFPNGCLCNVNKGCKDCKDCQEVKGRSKAIKRLRCFWVHVQPCCTSTINSSDFRPVLRLRSLVLFSMNICN